MASFAFVSGLVQAAFSDSFKPPRHGWPDFHHRSTMMGNPMPRLRTRTGNEMQPQICSGELNCVKLKVDEETMVSTAVTGPFEALGDHLNFNRNDTDIQGQDVTGAYAPQSAPARRWAGILMGEDGFESTPDLRDALRIAMDEAGTAKCLIDYALYEEFFDGIDATDEQKRQIIDALFLIGNSFYDAGFAYEIRGWACGKLEESEDSSALGSQYVVDLEFTSLSEKFNQCAA